MAPAPGPVFFTDDPIQFVTHPLQGVLLPVKSRWRRFWCRHMGSIVLGRMDEPKGYLRSRQVQQSFPASRLLPQVEIRQCTRCGELFAENCWTWELEVHGEWQRRKLRT